MSTRVLRWIGLGLLYILASPIHLIVWIRRAIKFYRSAALMRSGFIPCPHCGTTNPLDILATCPKCHTTEYGNRLRCTGCGEQTRSFDCDACGVTIKVL